MLLSIPFFLFLVSHAHLNTPEIYLKAHKQANTIFYSRDNNPVSYCIAIPSTFISRTKIVQRSLVKSRYPRRSRSAIGVDTVFTLDVCLYVCMLAL